MKCQECTGRLHVAIGGPCIGVYVIHTSGDSLTGEPDLILIASWKRNVLQLMKPNFSACYEHSASNAEITLLLLELGAEGAIDFIKSNGSSGEEPSPLRRIVNPAPVVLLNK